MKEKTAMGAAKNNPTTITTSGRGRFAPDQIELWEADRCVAFAIAIAIERLRGWPVYTTFVGDEIVRFQAEDASDKVYDPRGIFTAERFGDAIIVPMARTRRDWPPSAFQNGHLRIGTKCVGEEGLAELGIAVHEASVEEALSRIKENAVYFDLIPERPRPRLPAKALSRYSWSGCVVYAEALSRITGLPAMTMRSAQIAAGHGITGDHFHAVVQHPDGSAEDIWGRQTPQAVGRRYAMVRWTLDEQSHRAMIEEAYRIRPKAGDDVAQAEALIRRYRDTGPRSDAHAGGRG